MQTSNLVYFLAHIKGACFTYVKCNEEYAPIVTDFLIDHHFKMEPIHPSRYDDSIKVGRAFEINSESQLTDYRIHILNHVNKTEL